MKPLIILLAAVLCTISSPAVSQWTRVAAPDTANIQCVFAYGSMLLGGSSGYNGPSVYASTDNGDHWDRRDTGFEWHQKVSTFYATATYLFAGTSRGVMRSSDEGKTWENVLLRLSAPFLALIIHGKYLFAAADTVFRSNDSGNSWVAMNKNLYPVSSFVTSGSSVLGTTDYYVARSTNDGVDWYGMTLPDPNHLFSVTSIIYQKPRLITAKYRDGYYLSTDLGVHWVAVDTGDRPHSVTSMIANGTSIFAGRSPGGGVFLSEDNGSHWRAVNAGLGDSSVLSLTVSNGYLFAATLNGVWRRSLSEIQNGVQNNEDALFKVSEPFPNPAENQTNISFSLSRPSSVSLGISDLCGTEIKKLSPGFMSTGQHSLSIDTHDLSSGTYFIRVQTYGSSLVKMLRVYR